MAEDSIQSTNDASNFLSALICGGLAGTSVDVALFPIDTLKTRLQSPQGFAKAGGFRGIYNGLGAAAIGSAPGAALFFSTYETLKPVFSDLQERYNIQPDQGAISHMAAASVGESAACLVRVPTEVIKAKMQTGTGGTGGGLKTTIQMVLKETHGTQHNILAPIFGGLYRGYAITLMREIPFAMIQFPLYEQFKLSWSDYQGVAVSPVQAAACGSFAGAIAAGATTPLDVVKTRLMLGVDQHGNHYRNAMDVVQKTMAESPMKFWSGVQPRVMWISIGGFVFFGAYEGFRSVFSTVL
ncbi:adenosylmethionine carrier 1, chloroplastic/mitochondrial [Seminavis robusta]|uniref:Adenosylmethionine carrier 1, chloroplastic/mitochondrial n=1 Tax=Seminavis robusta TaxID=568900 RepID=A0A9N8D9P3_9STRA|nr:adenosylmethionine carrier 1, chloroplastic/mitochondrial [Seminavis robusta]|eukprot:Sro54_g032010.1 adenosylmethionine carrier 1, chloroplastic/mitochondrial (297) ;mRNA; r:110146-111152